MHYYRQSHKDVIHHFSKVTAIVLLSVTLPIVPLALTLQPLTVQA